MTFNPAFIISPEVLHTHLSDFIIIDIRERRAYIENHLPNAIWFDASLLNRNDAPRVGLLPAPNELALHLGNIGISESSSVVVYDDQGGPAAGRFVWTTRAIGAQHVAMLDGGFNAWHHLRLPINTQLAISRAAVTFKTALKSESMVDATWIQANSANPALCIIDARTPAEYRGEDVRSAHGGHIPNALNLNWLLTKDPDNSGRFKSPELLHRLFEATGINPQQTIVSYCQSHQRSALLCVLLEAMGYPQVKGYPGAWSDWGNRDDLPIETKS
ncbi:MAG: sulfurtransferase [Gammaproteobacteria bacterium]|nr:sulfurtransferase [Gammaproteobacteria bacterium]